MKHMRLFLSSLALAALLPLSAMASKADDTVRIAFAKDLDNGDVYFSSAREGVMFAFAVFEPLVSHDPTTGKFVGHLAESFHWIDDVTLEFKLRSGITFHNGDAFSADDVVFTFNHFSDPATGVAQPSTVNWIKSAEKVDDLTVRVHLKEPFPAALNYVEGALPIYPAKYYQKVGQQAFAKAPIGTGPYRAAKIDPGRGYTLVAHDGYKPVGPRRAAHIKTVEVNVIPDVNSQIANLFSGATDLIWQLPEDKASRVSAQGKYTVAYAPTVRFGYISVDAAGRSGKKEFTDRRVREAVYHAIDRATIRDALFDKSAEIINAACSPLQFGCDQNVKTYDYDPDKARKLLAEAGYPNGFTIDLYAYRDRQAAEAMAQMLQDVGIKVNLIFLQYAALTEKVLKGEVPAAFMTWGSASILDVSASTSKFFNGSAIDSVKDDKLSALLKQGDMTNDPDARKAAYSKALNTIADQAYWVPLWTYSANYVMNPELEFKPTPDEFIRFFDMSWK